MFRICRDGILRISVWCSSQRRHYAVPVAEYEKHLPSAFLGNLASEFEMEPGLTLGELMLNFEPWQDVLTAMCKMDFPAFLAEVRNAPATPPENMANYSHIAVRGYFQIDAEPDFTHPTEEEQKEAERRRAFLIGTPRITDKYRMARSWQFVGVLKEPEDDGQGNEILEYSLSYTPVSDYAHLPVMVDTVVRFSDYTVDSGYLTYKGGLFDPANPAVTSDHPRLRVLSLVEVPTVFDALLHGLFWDMGFHYSPCQRDEERAELNRRVEESKAEDAVFYTMVSDIAEVADRPVFDDPEPEPAESTDRHDYEWDMVQAVMAVCGDKVIASPRED